MRQAGVNSLNDGDILGKTIYTSSGRVLLGKGIKLTPAYIDRLKGMGLSILYIEDERFADVQIEDVISEEQRCDALRVLQKSAELVRLGKGQDSVELQNVVNDIVEEISAQQDIIVNMMDMRTLDNQMFAHSVNVCVLSTVLGKALLLDREKLGTLAIGAILHDIGKAQLDNKLVNKGSNLTTEERQLLNSHTTLGFEEIRKRKEISIVAAHIAFQHHEYMNGTGFPRQLKEGDIHPLAQIVGIADFYDRVTSGYGDIKRMMPHEACEILMGMAGTLYPIEMVRVFLKTIAAYPTGVTVKMNTNEIGVVVDQNLSMPTRPVIRVFNDASFESSTVTEYNMVEKLTLFVQEVIN